MTITLPKPWPHRPPADARCDAHAGTGTDRCGKPIVHRCDELATETVWLTDALCFVREMWLCATRAETFVTTGRALRNPRSAKKRAS